MGLGLPELIVIFLIILVVFGAGKLPQIGDALGRSIRNFKKATAAEEPVDVTPPRDALPPPTEKVASSVDEASRSKA